MYMEEKDLHATSDSVNTGGSNVWVWTFTCVWNEGYLINYLQILEWKKLTHTHTHPAHPRNKEKYK